MLQDLRPPSPYKQNDEGFHFLYDTTRGRWLSVERARYTFGINHVRASGKRWLTIDNIPSNLGGYIVERHSRITTVAFTAQTPGNGTIQVCLPDGTPLYNLNVSNEATKVIPNLDIPVVKETQLSALLFLGEFDYPKLTIELASEFI